MQDAYVIKIVTALGLLVVAVMLRSLRWPAVELGDKELHRRVERGDQRAILLLSRSMYVHRLRAVSDIAVTLLTAGASLLLSSSSNPLIALLAIPLVFLIAQQLALRRIVTALYEKHEPRLLRYASKYAWLEKIAAHQTMPRTVIGSREDLEECIKTVHFLSKPERRRVLALLSYQETGLRGLLLDERQIPFVNVTDHIGPKLLDELYKGGLKIYPVVQDDAIVGAVSLEMLMRHSAQERVRDIELLPVARIDGDVSLAGAVAAIVSAGAVLGAVDGISEATSVVYLEDCLRYIIPIAP